MRRRLVCRLFWSSQSLLLRSRKFPIIALCLFTLFIGVPFYRIVNAYAEELVQLQREVLSLTRHVLLLEARAITYMENIRKQTAAIADVAGEDLPETVKKKLKLIEGEMGKLATPQFRHRPETSHLDCSRLFAGDGSYVNQVERVVMASNRHLDMSCKGIRLRVLSYPRQPATNYAIAFARIVHTDYEFLEEQLRSSYSDENHFCYHVDSKASSDFKKSMKALSTCLPNVYLTDVRLDIDGREGTNTNFAHLACMKLLDKKGPWHYVILQQTYDVVIRTNFELKRIFQVLNGTNDVQITPCHPFFYDQNMKWDAESLDVFVGSSIQPSASALKVPLFIAKGAIQVSLSRAAVQWLNGINLTQLIKQFSSGGNSVDEMLMSTLQIAEHWKMPGGFTDRCLKHGFSYNGITRKVQWRDSPRKCKANFLRHNVCVLGVEDLPSISRYQYILVNKMMPSFDYGAIACVSELLFNRTHLGYGNNTLDMLYFENLPVVRFNKATNQKNISELCENPYAYKWEEA